MPLIKNGIVPSVRHNLYKQLELITDLALLDLSGKGHALYNLGHNSLLHIKQPNSDNLFSLPLTDAEVAVSNFDRVYKEIETILDKGYKNLFLMPSAIAKLTNFDYEQLRFNIIEKFNLNVFYLADSDEKTFLTNTIFNLNSQANRSNNPKDGFSILTPVFSYESKRDARYVKHYIETTYGEKCVFSNAERFNLSELTNLYGSKVIITLSDDFSGLANRLDKDTKLISCNHIALKNESNFITQLNEIFNKSVEVKYQKEYQIITEQFKNVIKFLGTQIVLFLENNLNDRLNNFFKSLDITVEIYTPYTSDKYKTISIDKFIQEYKDGNQIIISYDRIVRTLHRGITIESLGLDYYLIAPTPSRRIMTNGAFSLMEEIIKNINL